MATQHYVAPAEDEESYFISMTDVVIGLLFVFIIMLMFFAMRFQQATQTQNVATENLIDVTLKQNALINDLTDAEIARNDILDQIGSALQKEGINVIIVRDEGILRLPEDILFEKSSWEVKANARGVDPLKVLAKALDQVLPCYTVGPRSRSNDCPTTKAKVEAIFIEGHADSDQFRNSTNTVSPIPGNLRRPPSGAQRAFPFNIVSPDASTVSPPAQGEQRRPAATPPRGVLPPKDNLDLSALRATSTFRELLRVQPELSQYHNPNKTPILSVSGYGEYRPVAPEIGESAERFKQRNRRIDLRILMATVRSEDAKKMQQDFDRVEIRP
jgi:flagellar motor protein MotB